MAVEARQVEVGLVEAHHLHALDVAAQDGHDLARARAVVLEVGGTKTASGHSRRARSAGVAEKTPNLRAS